MNIGSRIKVLRKQAGFNQTSLAKALAVHRVTVARWEADKAVPSFDQIQRIAEVVGTDVIGLLGEDSSIPKAHNIIVEKGIEQLSGVGLKSLEDQIRLLNERLDRGELKVKMPEKKLEPINRRDELAEYRISKRGKGVAIPKWLNMACGAGCELERSPDLIYFEEIRNSNLLHSAVVRGNSMTQTLNPGDVVILEEFPGGPIVLEPRGDDPKNSYRMLHARIPADAICVVGLNGDAPTLKRVMYDFSRGVVDWRLMIVADNAFEWNPRSVSRNDEIKFYAKLIGIAAQ